MLKRYTVTLVEHRMVAEGTLALLFEKPEDFSFTAGQFVDLTLGQFAKTDETDRTRAFSLASAPEESALLVATRLRDSAFKQTLHHMPLGTAVQILGPFGDLVLPADETRPAVLLAGGIGITPFRSMLVDAALRHSPRPLVLFYSNRRPEDAPFLEELQVLPHTNPHFTFVGTMTDPTRSDRLWHGATGRLTADVIAKYVVNLESPLYYVVGPPAMVTGMQALLTDIHINKRDIRTEQFVGY